MKTESANNSSYEMLKCIWMASQVIEYKLCDNKFDCEKCLFDKVMRNLLNEKETRSAGIADVVNLISDKLQSLEYDDKIIYLNKYFIAKEICRNTYYIGLNPVLICFLDNLSSLVMNCSGENILAGQHLIQICGPWGKLDFKSPGNFLIYDKVGDPDDSPWKSQWFAIIGLDQIESFNERLSRADWSKMRGKALEKIEEIKMNVPKVGTTMADGGTQIKFLHQLVGNKKYIDLLSSLEN